MTETEPRDSTECNFLTIAFRFAILNTPNASVTVVTIGSPSGIAATANDTRNTDYINNIQLSNIICTPYLRS